MYNNDTDVGPYRGDEAYACWHGNDCELPAQIIESCYLNVGPLTDPNDKNTSINYQWCMCGQLGNWYQPPEYVKNIFVFCTLCLNNAGVPREVTRPMNVTLDNYCLSPGKDLTSLLIGSCRRC